MQDSECIIAVNKNETAPIFEIADYGICGDLFKVTPMLIEAIKAAKPRSNFVSHTAISAPHPTGCGAFCVSRKLHECKRFCGIPFETSDLLKFYSYKKKNKIKD